jgi:hypothetical protein
MSHEVYVENFDIVSLEALDRACERIECELIQNKTRMRIFDDTRSCDHVITVPECDWDIGIRRGKINENGHQTYNLVADFYGSNGKILERKVSQLRQFYPIELAKMLAEEKGYLIKEEMNEDGNIHLTAYVEEEI